MFLSEDSRVSLRKVWSTLGILVFATYAVVDLVSQYVRARSISMPAATKWVVLTIVGFYFVRRGVDAAANFAKRRLK